MDPLSRRAQPPVGLSHAPPGMPGEREIELLRLVRMGGIFGLGPEEKNAAGDRIALERPALADPFAPAVVLQETLAEIGAGIGLPPVEIAGQRRDGFDQRLGLRGGEALEALERGNDGKRMRGLRPRGQLLRPVAEERRSLRAGGLEQAVEGGHERAQGTLEPGFVRHGVEAQVVVLGHCHSRERGNPDSPRRAALISGCPRARA
jgi:hypothetical protein